MKSNYRFNPAVVGLLFILGLTTGCGGSESSGVIIGGGDSDSNGEATDTDMTNTGMTDTGMTDTGSTGADPDPEDVDPDTDAGMDTDTDTDTPTPVPPVENEARYRVTFSANWSAETHPINFPNNPHFSPMTGAVHSEQSVLWELGQIASDGVEEMAESGAVGILVGEIQSVIDEGRALTLIEEAGVATSPGTLFFDLIITRENPLVTLVSMLAPSPDWFIGVNGLSLVYENGDFKDSMTVDLRLYDAGTDGGTGFTSADENTFPRSPISLVNSFPSDSNFVEGEPYVGQLAFDKI